MLGENDVRRWWKKVVESTCYMCSIRWWTNFLKFRKTTKNSIAIQIRKIKSCVKIEKTKAST
jgi:hypothetical protein